MNLAEVLVYSHTTASNIGFRYIQFRYERNYILLIPCQPWLFLIQQLVLFKGRNLSHYFLKDIISNLRKLVLTTNQWHHQDRYVVIASAFHSKRPFSPSRQHYEWRLRSKLMCIVYGCIHLSFNPPNQSFSA